LPVCPNRSELVGHHDSAIFTPSSVKSADINGSYRKQHVVILACADASMNAPCV
jgi:hypothetical protein